LELRLIIDLIDLIELIDLVVLILVIDKILQKLLLFLVIVIFIFITVFIIIIAINIIFVVIVFVFVCRIVFVLYVMSYCLMANKDFCYFPSVCLATLCGGVDQVC